MSFWVINTITVFALSILLAGILIPQILLIAYRRKLFDEVDERKVHKGLIPRLGGFAFVPVIMLSIALTLAGNTLVGDEQFGEEFLEWGLLMTVLFCSIQMLYLIGIADDLVGIKYRAKFVVQIICAVLLISAGCWFTSLGGVLGINEVSPWFGMPFTAIVIVFVVNSINLIDGIDGLASGLSSIAAAIYGFSFLLLGQYAFAILAFAMLGVLFPFFYYNVFGDPSKHSKIFMGDTGSLTIGLLLSVLGIKLFTHPTDAVLDFQPCVLAFSPLIIPSFDVIRVYIVRIRNHQSPFLPDRNHIHHKFLAAGMTPRPAMVSIITISTTYTLLNLALSRFMNVNLIVVTDVVIWILFHLWLNRRIRSIKDAHKA